nr:hypothetical protein B0A51_05306 [Rachicladosporium sp. CCFEE 5018]
MAPRRAPETQPTRRSGRIEAAKVAQQAILDEQNKVKKPKRFRRPQQRRGCHLLNKLPGEIRNMIWRNVVVQGSISVTSEGPGEPALLRVCRQIRRETLRIPHTENDFLVRIVHYDGAALAPFARQHERYGDATSNFRMVMTGNPNWENLLKWLKEVVAHWCDLIPDLSDDDSDCACCRWPHKTNDKILAGMFRAAMELRGRVMWAVAEKVLEGAHQALAAVSPQWA